MESVDSMMLGNNNIDNGGVGSGALSIGSPEDNNNNNNSHTIQFESPTHTSTILNGLNSLRNKGLLVDITLVAGGEVFEAHRVVLSSCSDYFRAMFTTEVKESKQKVVTLEGVSALGMHLLLDYAYTSRLILNLANIQDILSAASHLQLITVVEACSNYLQTQLDLDNCVDIVTLAETYSLHNLKKRVYKFMSGQLMEFSQTPDFQRLSTAQLHYLLDCDYPVDCPESDVLQIILQWINFNDERISVSPLLLSKVHYDKISSDVLKFIWDHSLLPCISSQCHTLYKMIVNQMISSDPSSTTTTTNGSSRNSITGNLVNSRGMELAIIKVGYVPRQKNPIKCLPTLKLIGFGKYGVTNEITYYLPSVGRWKRLTTIPHLEQSNFGIAVLHNQLYIVGGCFNQQQQENIHPFGFCFDPRFNKWTTLAPMLTERCRFTLNVVGDKLYAIGGANENVEDVQNPPEEFCLCESYDPETDTWRNIADLPIPRTQHAAASWNNKLFISGGLEQDIVSSSLLCYDVERNEWEVKAPMLNGRADHCMVMYQDKLLTIGGWYEDEAIGNRLLVSTIDEYDIITNTWRVLTEIPTPRFHAGICIVRDKLLIIGGFHCEAIFDRTTGVIECYDLSESKWSTAERYPEDIWEHCCATLHIPKSREDLDVREVR